MYDIKYIFVKKNMYAYCFFFHNVFCFAGGSYEFEFACFTSFIKFFL